MIDIRHLQLFVAVAEELHFGRAAARIGMAQPPFSQQIRRLEARLGVALLHRTSRQVSLTSAGHALLREARELIARRDRIVGSMRSAATGQSGTLRIGFGASSVIGVLAAVIREVRVRLPDVELQLDDRDGIDFATAVRIGALDVAIVRGPFTAPGVAVELLHREHLVAVLPISHRFAERASLSPRDIADSSFILFPRAAAPGLHDTIVGMCMEAGFSPNVVQEAHGWLSVVGLIDSGLGISIAPASAARVCPANVVCIPLHETQGMARIAIVSSDTATNPLVPRFRDIARYALGALGDAAETIASVPTSPAVAQADP